MQLSSPESGEGGALASDRINEDLAWKVLLALLSQPTWMTRTVESVSFVDRHTVRRRISRHYAIPEEQHCPKMPSGMVRLPVFGVAKGQALSCDLIDQSRRAVSLPPLRERALYSAAALRKLSEAVLGRKDRLVFAEIEEFVMAGPRSCEEKLLNGTLALGTLFADQHFRRLARYLAHNYVVYVDVPPSGPELAPQRIIRFELDARFPHKRHEVRETLESESAWPGSLAANWPSSRGLRPAVPFFMRTALRGLGLMSFPYRHYVALDGAGSVHVDIEASEGVAFGDRRLGISSDGQSVHSSERRGTSSRRAHFLVSRGRGRGVAAMSVNIRPAPGLLRNGSIVLLYGFAVLLGVIAWEFDVLAGKGAAVPLLLLLSGLVSVITARSNEHPYVTGVLFGIRVMAIAPIPFSVIAAMVVLTNGAVPILTVLAAISALLGTILLAGRVVDELNSGPELDDYVEDNLTRIG